MKKRSLISAVAMLIVSAIVLTSATYAWFAANTTANVEKIEATVTNGDGSIELSADNSVWTLSLSKTALAAQAGNSFPNALSPVSFDIENDTQIGGMITDGTFTAASAEGSFVAYTFYVRATAECTVKMTNTFSALQGYNFAYVKVGEDSAILGSSTDGYNPLTCSEGESAVDANNDYILSADEAAFVSASTITAEGTAKDITLSFTAGETKEVVVYMWAEGQHKTCTGTNTNTDTISIATAFEIVK